MRLVGRRRWRILPLFLDQGNETGQGFNRILSEDGFLAFADGDEEIAFQAESLFPLDLEAFRAFDDPIGQDRRVFGQPKSIIFAVIEHPSFPGGSGEEDEIADEVDCRLASGRRTGRVLRLGRYDGILSEAIVSGTFLCSLQFPFLHGFQQLFDDHIFPAKPPVA